MDLSAITQQSLLHKTELLFGELITQLAPIKGLIEHFLSLLQELIADNLHKQSAQLNQRLHVYIPYVLIRPQCDLRLVDVLEAPSPHHSETRGLLHHRKHGVEDVRKVVA